MLVIDGQPGRLCDAPSRRELLTVGGLALFGLGLPRLFAAAAPGALGNVALCGPVREGAVTGVGQFAGLLGSPCDPFPMYEDPTQPLRTESLELPGDVTLGRLRGRLDLRRTLARGPHTPGVD